MAPIKLPMALLLLAALTACTATSVAGPPPSGEATGLVPGGGNIIAAGSGNLVAAGAGNVIGHNGAAGPAEGGGAPAAATAPAGGDTAPAGSPSPCPSDTPADSCFPALAEN